MEVKVPEPQITNYAKAEFATETAFEALLAEAQKSGLSLLLALTPKESHVVIDGEETFSSES